MIIASFEPGTNWAQLQYFTPSYLLIYAYNYSPADFSFIDSFIHSCLTSLSSSLYSFIKMQHKMTLCTIGEQDMQGKLILVTSWNAHDDTFSLSFSPTFSLPLPYLCKLLCMLMCIILWLFFLSFVHSFVPFLISSHYLFPFLSPSYIMFEIISVCNIISSCDDAIDKLHHIVGNLLLPTIQYV